MSANEDTRRVLQDFLAPELREISSRLESLETRMGSRFKNVDKQFKQVDERFKQVDDRFTQAERRAAERHEELMRAIASLEKYSELRERPARLEARQQSEHQTAA